MSYKLISIRITDELKSKLKEMIKKEEAENISDAIRKCLNTYFIDRINVKLLDAEIKKTLYDVKDE